MVGRVTEMTSEQRKEWLASLKPGDDVALEIDSDAGTYWVHDTIDSATGPHLTLAQNSGWFRPHDGERLRGPGDPPIKLVPVTDDMRRIWQLERRSALADWIRETPLTPAQLTRIEAIVEEAIHA